MDIKAQLLLEHSKQNSLIIRDYLLKYTERIPEFMDLFFGPEYRVSQRAAMVLSALFDYKKELLIPYLEPMVSCLEDTELKVAVKRNVVRILQEIDVPEDLLSSLFDSCIRFLNDPGEPIAVKAFSMKVLVNICQRFPELKLEAQPIIEAEVERNTAKGIQARGRHMLKALSKI